MSNRSFPSMPVFTGILLVFCQVVSTVQGFTSHHGSLTTQARTAPQQPWVSAGFGAVRVLPINDKSAAPASTTTLSTLTTRTFGGSRIGSTNGPSRQDNRFWQLKAAPSDFDSPETNEIRPDGPIDEDLLFDPKMTLGLIAGQSTLIAVAIGVSAITKTPNFGFGPDIAFDAAALQTGLLCTAPLGVLAVVLEYVEPYVPALQDVTKATQNSVMALLGGTFKPLIAIAASLALGAVAGLGEEMLFRGIMQYELADRFGDALALGSTSIIFGLLHAVTPMYALLATLASLYFGYLYEMSGNLAVPIVTHGVYDFGALMASHWTVSQFSDLEREQLLEWIAPAERGEDEADIEG